MSHAFHQRERAASRQRIGAIGTEIGAQYAATKCTDFGRRRGGVVVLVDNCGVCWAITAGSPLATMTIERETALIVGTFVPGDAPRGLATEIRDGIRERMAELGAVELAA